MVDIINAGIMGILIPGREDGTAAILIIGDGARCAIVMDMEEGIIAEGILEYTAPIIAAEVITKVP